MERTLTGQLLHHNFSDARNQYMTLVCEIFSRVLGMPQEGGSEKRVQVVYNGKQWIPRHLV